MRIVAKIQEVCGRREGITNFKRRENSEIPTLVDLPSQSRIWSVTGGRPKVRQDGGPDTGSQSCYFHQPRPPPPAARALTPTSPATKVLQPHSQAVAPRRLGPLLENAETEEWPGAGVELEVRKRPPEDSRRARDFESAPASARRSLSPVQVLTCHRDELEAAAVRLGRRTSPTLTLPSVAAAGPMSAREPGRAPGKTARASGGTPSRGPGLRALGSYQRTPVGQSVLVGRRSP